MHNVKGIVAWKWSELYSSDYLPWQQGPTGTALRWLSWTTRRARNKPKRQCDTATSIRSLLRLLL